MTPSRFSRLKYWSTPSLKTRSWPTSPRRRRQSARDLKLSVLKPLKKRRNVDKSSKRLRKRDTRTRKRLLKIK